MLLSAFHTWQALFHREVAAEWQGLLIGYEILGWFESLQVAHRLSHDPHRTVCSRRLLATSAHMLSARWSAQERGLLRADLAWPSKEQLGATMRMFKATRHT